MPTHRSQVLVTLLFRVSQRECVIVRRILDAHVAQTTLMLG